MKSEPWRQIWVTVIWQKKPQQVLNKSWWLWKKRQERFYCMSNISVKVIKLLNNK